MKIEAGRLATQKTVRVRVRVRNVRKVITKAKRERGASNGRRRLEPKVPSALQKLFLMCREAFHGPGTVPLPADVQKLCCILDAVKLEDFGLSRDMPLFKSNGASHGIPRVAYTTIYSCTNFSLCLFFLPATGVIPLHNHPGMTVFSKLLLGTLHMKAYDWVHSDTLDPNAPLSQSRLARLKIDEVRTAPCNTTVLYPMSGGNIHALTALTPCIVLDVLGPPYSKDEDRDCTYYQDIPCTNCMNGESMVGKEDGGGYGWLKEIEIPETSEMDVIEYLGPQIVDTNCLVPSVQYLSP